MLFTNYRNKNDIIDDNTLKYKNDVKIRLTKLQLTEKSIFIQMQLK